MNRRSQSTNPLGVPRHRLLARIAHQSIGFAFLWLIGLSACTSANGDSSEVDLVALNTQAQDTLRAATASLFEGDPESALRSLDATARWRRKLDAELRGQLELLVGKANLAFAKQRIANGGGGAIIDGSFLDAQDALQKAARDLPDDDEALRLLSESYSSRGQLDEAVQAATRAVDRVQKKSARGASEPRLVPALIARARAQIYKLAEMRKGSSEDPNEEQLLFANEIFSDLSKAKNLDPKRSESYQLASTAYRWLGRTDDAIRALEDGVRAHPNHNPHHSGLQGLYFGQKRGAALVGLYRRMTREQERPNATTVWWLGRALFSRADELRSSGDRKGADALYTESEAAFQKSAEIQPSFRGSTEVYRALCAVSKARMALEEGDESFAEKELDRAYAITPEIAALDENGFDRRYDSFQKTYRGGIYALGDGMVGGGDGLENAIRFFRKITKRHADWGPAWNNLGLAARDHAVLVEKTGDKDAAMALYEESYAAYLNAAKLVPDDARIQNDTGLMLIYHLHRDRDSAIAQFQKAIRIGSEQLDELPESDDDDTKAQRKDLEEAVGDAWQNWGLALEQLGKNQDAVSKYEKAIEFHPNKGREAFKRARALREKLGTTTEASGDKREARQLRPAFGSGLHVIALAALLGWSSPDLHAQDGADAVADALAKIAEGDAEAALRLVERGLGKSEDPERWYCAGMGSLLFAKQRMAAQASGVDANLIDAIDRLQKADALTRNHEGPSKHLGTAIHTEPVRFAIEAMLLRGKAKDALELGQRHLTHLDSMGLKYDAKTLAALFGQIASAGVRHATAQYQSKAKEAKKAADVARRLGTRFEKKLSALDAGARDEMASDTFAYFRSLATLEEWAARGVAAIRAWERAGSLLPGKMLSNAAGQVTGVGTRVSESGKAADVVAAWRKSGKGDAATLAWYTGYAKVFHGHEHRMGSRNGQAVKCYAAARKDFESAIRSNSQFEANSKYWIGMSWAAEGAAAKTDKKTEKALALWMKAVKTDARVALQQDSLGQSAQKGVMLEVDALYRDREYDEAAKLCERYVDALGKDDKNILNNIGFFWREHGNRSEGTERRKAHEAAWKAYKRAASLAADDPRVLADTALIDIYYLRQNREESERLCRRAIEVGETRMRENPPEDKDQRNALAEAIGDAYMNLGYMLIDFEKRWEEAESLLRKSLDFHPGPNVRASRRHLRRLRRLRSEKKG